MISGQTRHVRNAMAGYCNKTRNMIMSAIGHLREGLRIGVITFSLVFISFPSCLEVPSLAFSYPCTLQMSSAHDKTIAIWTQSLWIGQITLLLPPYATFLTNHIQRLKSIRWSPVSHHFLFVFCSFLLDSSYKFFFPHLVIHSCHCSRARSSCNQFHVSYISFSMVGHLETSLFVYLPNKSHNKNEFGQL